MAMEENMKPILRAVLAAQQLDGSNNMRAAYVSYLQCIHQVASILLQDTQIPGFCVSAGTKKCVQLGNLCMERIVELVDSLQQESIWRKIDVGFAGVTQGTVGDTSRGPAPGVSQGPAPSTVRGPAPSTVRGPAPSTVRGPAPSTVRGPVPGASPSPVTGTIPGPTTSTMPSDPSQAVGYALPELPSPTKSLQSYIRRSAEPSPMEIAQRKNQQLMLAYKKRMASISAKSPSATNISLSLQRRMAENMAIARGREEALAKKVQERQRRLEEEAARRFASTAGMSKDEQERRHIYSQVLIYEADAKYLQTWRQKLSATPDNGKLIQDLILLVLNTKDHPLTQLLTKLQYSIYDKLRPLVLSYIHELNRISVPYIPSPDRETTPGTIGSQPKEDPSQSPKGAHEPILSTPDVSQEGAVSATTTDKTMGEVCEETREDLETALKQNMRISQTLEADIKRSDDITKGLSDVDKFDDLFEDSAGEVNESAITGDPVMQTSFDTSDMDIVKDLATVTDEERIENLKKDALDKHMGYITADVREGMDKLSAMFIVAYEALDSAAGRDLCWSSLEEPFFKPLWPYLIALYRLGSYHQEVKAAKAMTRLIDVSPTELGVKDKFCPKIPGARPFQSCIDELTRITSLTSPLTKLESVVRLCKLLCQIMEEYSSSTQSGSTQHTTGADDLLPVLSYVVIHARLPQLVAECHAMEEFIHEGYLMGEEGYCLTSLQTSLSYVISKADSSTSPDAIP